MEREEGEPEREISDWDGYTRTACEGITEVLRPILEREPFCEGVRYDGMSSPRYYNFSTDKLIVTMQLDLDELKEWVLSDDTRRESFDEYLHKKYTSYDGFISFVSNNIDDYFNESYEEYPDVLVDYYVLVDIIGDDDIVSGLEHHTDLLPYEWDILDAADEAFYRYFVPVENDDDDDDDDD